MLTAIPIYSIENVSIPLGKLYILIVKSDPNILSLDLALQLPDPYVLTLQLSDTMSDGMARLKMLASGLGDEIQSQNDQIDDRIMPSVERADQNIRDQNRQMKRILGVKK